MIRVSSWTAIAAAAVFAACGRADSTDPSAVPTPVKAVAAVRAPMLRTVEAVGTLRGVQEATLAGKVMGTIVEIRKQAGDAVRRGETVVVVDARDVAGQLAQADGALAQARSAATLAEANFSRFEQLAARGSASALELDQARYQRDAARAAIAQADGAVATARSYRDYAEIAAPFDGRVVDRLCEVGDLAAPGRPLMKLESNGRTRLDVFVQADAVAGLVPGQGVSVEVPSLGERRFRGTVGEIVPAADPATRSFLVKVVMEEDPALRAGLFGRASFGSGMRTALRVPRTLVRERGGLTGVLVAEDGRAMFRLVTTGRPDGDSVEVLAGLSEGDLLIIGAPATLQAGVPVEVEG